MIRLTVLVVLLILSGCGGMPTVDTADVEAGCSVKEAVQLGNTLFGDLAPVPGAGLAARGVNRIWDVACADPEATARMVAEIEKRAKEIRNR